MGSRRVGVACLVATVTLFSLPAWPSTLGLGTVGFVEKASRNLTVNGKPWQFTGFNGYVLAQAPEESRCGGPLSDAELGARLDRIKMASGGNVVRAWFFQSMGGPGRWDGFDRLLSMAKAREMRVIATLGNEWDDCEPSRPFGRHLLPWYQGGYARPDPGYALSFRDYAVQVAARYATEPAVAFWQLVNEAEAPAAAPKGGVVCDEAAARAALRTFADGMVTALRRVDRNHLVSLGTIGSGQCGAAGSAGYRYVHAGKVDLCEYHDYGSPGSAMPGDQWNGLGTRIADCAVLDKPIFIGEAGLCADASGPCPGGPLTPQERAAAFDAKLTAQFRAGVVGYLIWSAPVGAVGDPFAIAEDDPTEEVLLRHGRRPGPSL